MDTSTHWQQVGDAWQTAFGARWPRRRSGLPKERAAGCRPSVGPAGRVRRRDVEVEVTSARIR